LHERRKTAAASRIPVRMTETQRQDLLLLLSYTDPGIVKWIRAARVDGAGFLVSMTRDDVRLLAADVAEEATLAMDRKRQRRLNDLHGHLRRAVRHVDERGER